GDAELPEEAKPAKPAGHVATPHPATLHPATHGIIRLAPTQRSSQYAPSGSRTSSRESFTPRVELWINFHSPTYSPTCVTPEPGRAEKSRMSPGRSASTTVATSAPARAWSRLMRGNRIPCWQYAYCTRPEQSNPLSALPPQV